MVRVIHQLSTTIEQTIQLQTRGLIESPAAAVLSALASIDRPIHRCNRPPLVVAEMDRYRSTDSFTDSFMSCLRRSPEPRPVSERVRSPPVAVLVSMGSCVDIVMDFLTDDRSPAKSGEPCCSAAAGPGPSSAHTHAHACVSIFFVVVGYQQYQRLSPTRPIETVPPARRLKAGSQCIATRVRGGNGPLFTKGSRSRFGASRGPPRAHRLRIGVRVLGC